MKHTLLITTALIITALMLVVGCSKPINEDSLIDRNGVKYQQDSQKPYSGKVFRLYDTGENKNEGIYKDGKLEGLWIEWYENGQKKLEVTFKDGKEDGLFTKWYDNGQKGSEGTYKNGKQDGLFTSWYENGQKSEEITYKDGEMIEWTWWDEDGNEY